MTGEAAVKGMNVITKYFSFQYDIEILVMLYYTSIYMYFTCTTCRCCSCSSDKMSVTLVWNDQQHFTSYHFILSVLFLCMSNSNPLLFLKLYKYIIHDVLSLLYHVAWYYVLQGVHEHNMKSLWMWLDFNSNRHTCVIDYYVMNLA